MHEPPLFFCQQYLHQYKKKCEIKALAALSSLNYLAVYIVYIVYSITH